MRVERVRTFHARRGRRSALTDTRLATVLPRYAAWPGLFAGAPNPQVGPLVGPLVGPQPGAALGELPTGGGRAAYRPVVLEVGCGHGAAALAYAIAHPDEVLVALDVYPAGVARLVAAADTAGLVNLAAELGDAVAFLDERVPSGSLSGVHVFFPDPWPKVKHHGRRFVSAETVELLADRLTDDGAVLVATDWPGYVEHVERVLDAHGGFVARRVPRPAWRPVAGYEAKALAAGRAVVDLLLTKR